MGFPRPPCLKWLLLLVTLFHHPAHFLLNCPFTNHGAVNHSKTKYLKQKQSFGYIIPFFGTGIEERLGLVASVPGSHVTIDKR
jgi:hypothetical protein